MIIEGIWIRLLTGHNTSSVRSHFGSDGKPL